MATNEPKKRQLAFKNYEEMMVEVHALIASGYICNGNWTLSQACGHIADWMRLPDRWISESAAADANDFLGDETYRRARDETKDTGRRLSRRHANGSGYRSQT